MPIKHLVNCTDHYFLSGKKRNLNLRRQAKKKYIYILQAFQYLNIVISCILKKSFLIIIHYHFKDLGSFQKLKSSGWICKYKVIKNLLQILSDLHMQNQPLGILLSIQSREVGD